MIDSPVTPQIEGQLFHQMTDQFEEILLPIWNKTTVWRKNYWVNFAVVIGFSAIFVKISFALAHFFSEKLSYKPYPEMTASEVALRKFIVVSVFMISLSVPNIYTIKILQPPLSISMIISINVLCMAAMSILLNKG